MAYEIVNKSTGDREILTERRAEMKYGSADFNLMIAGAHNTYTATNLNVRIDNDEFLGTMDEEFIGDPLSLIN